MDGKMVKVDSTAGITGDFTSGNLPVPDHKASQMGMYAGFVTRAAALMIDIVLITVAVLAINALLGLPVSFFTGINLNNCAQTTDPRAIAKAACTALLSRST